MSTRALLAALILAAAGCAPEWQGFWSRFESNVTLGRAGGPVSLDWQVQAAPTGGSRIAGYADNTTNYRLGRVYLQIDALDSRDQVTARRYWWVLGDIPANGRAYFETPGLPVADRYRVGVYSYAIESDPVF